MQWYHTEKQVLPCFIFFLSFLCCIRFWNCCLLVYFWLRLWSVFFFTFRNAWYKIFWTELKVNVILTSQTWRTSDTALWKRHLSLDSCVKLLPTEMGSWHCLPASGCPLCVCFNWKLIVRGLLWKWYHCLQTANPAFCKETLVVLFVLVDLRSSKAWRRKGDANILLKKINLHIYNIIFECQSYQVFLTNFCG